MTIESRLSDDGAGLVCQVRDMEEGSEYERLIVDLESMGERARSLRYIVVDYSALTTPSVTSAEINALATMSRRLVSSLCDCVTAVVADKQAVFGMARMWQSFAEVRGLDAEYRVVRSRHEAEAWIRERMREKHGFEPTFT